MQLAAGHSTSLCLLASSATHLFPLAAALSAALSAGSWMGRIALRREYGRLASLLAAMPTTDGEDEALLAGGSLGGRTEELLVRFRLQRKRALRRALERLDNARMV